MQDNVVPYRRRSKKRKFSKMNALLILSFAALALFVYYLASPLALVDKIEIIGNTYLQAPDIERIAGLQPGKHLWRTNLAASRDKLAANPWIKEVQVSRIFPNSIRISLTERTGVAVILGTDCNWVLSNDKVVLGENAGFSLPLLTGLELGSLETGITLEGQAIDQALAWTNALQPVSGQISEINFDSFPVIITVFTTDGYKVLFDTLSVPEDKVEDFVILVQELRSSGQKGIIDLRGVQGQGFFIPWPGYGNQ